MDDGGGCGCCDGGGVWVKWERGGLPRDAFEVNQAPLFIACTEARTRPRVRWTRPCGHPLYLSSLITIVCIRLHTPPCWLGMAPCAEAYLYYQDLQDYANLSVDHALY